MWVEELAFGYSLVAVSHATNYVEQPLVAEKGVTRAGDAELADRHEGRVLGVELHDRSTAFHVGVHYSPTHKEDVTSFSGHSPMERRQLVFESEWQDSPPHNVTLPQPRKPRNVKGRVADLEEMQKGLAVEEVSGLHSERVLLEQSVRTERDVHLVGTATDRLVACFLLVGHLGLLGAGEVFGAAD